jgi:hypothetical protein
MFYLSLNASGKSGAVRITEELRNVKATKYVWSNTVQMMVVQRSYRMGRSDYAQ